MKNSILIARLMGPVLLIMGLGMVVESETVRDLTLEFLGNRALIYFAGILTLVAGLAIVNAHNVWVTDWRVIITILGWLAVVGGVIRLLLPGQVQALGTGMVANPNATIVGGIITLVLGGILSWMGYEALWTGGKRRPATARTTPAKTSTAKRTRKPARRRRR